MASSSNQNRNYHVFLSFRGADVRKNFLSHLYAALDEKGIHTFVDSEELRIGEQISAALVRAIEESSVAIIIFSKDYASSPWCLEEVVKIMECHEQKGLIVFPVFYKVEPREVRGGRESYGRAMAKHESKFGENSEKVRRWKKALFDAGSLSGWNSNDSDEAELIRCIVKELSKYVDRTPLDVAKYPVGIDSRVQELISLSEKESSADDVLMIGLWGPGGIGKTTTAKAFYNAIETQFQGSSFLARVRETSNQSNGLVTLQEQLLSQILFHKTVTVYSVDGGINLIRERLRCKKVLLILDDVDQMAQLNALAGKRGWFGEGSRIIVTSRDRHLLTSHGINCVYEVQSLGYKEALDLFSRHAFPNGRSVEIRMELIDRALHYANGLPLALEVLGSFLCGRNESAWESALDKLSKSPDQTIIQVLKTSFDGLEDNEREIFLDIACFFKGGRIGYIEEVLDSCDFDTTIGIEILIERSLIKNEFGILEMHDLVQLMGKHIVNKECPGNPGKRSRIWLFEDALDILCENTETNAVKAIVLNRPAPEEITISPNAFANMKMLRILILRVHISSRGPVRLPNGLRWLEWPNAPDLEFGSGPKKLVSLNVCNSPIKQLGGEFQNFRKLKSINLHGCESLANVPDLSSAPNLEVLCSKDCKNLATLPLSIYKLKNLKRLDLQNCSNFVMFPKNLKDSIDPDGNLGFQNLEVLLLEGCNLSDAEFLERSSNFPKLNYLSLPSDEFIHLMYDSWKGLFVHERKRLQDSSSLPSDCLEVDLSSCCKSEGGNVADGSSLEKVPKTRMGTVFLGGREMPEWILPGNEGLISIMVPRDLYDKFLGLAICVVLGPEGRYKVRRSYQSSRSQYQGMHNSFRRLNFQISVNGGKLFEGRINPYKRILDGVWLYYVPRSSLNGVEKLMSNEWSHFQVCFMPAEVSVKCGFRLVCEQQEDDLRFCTPPPSADAKQIGNSEKETQEEDNFQ